MNQSDISITGIRVWSVILNGHFVDIFENTPPENSFDGMTSVLPASLKLGDPINCKADSVGGGRVVLAGTTLYSHQYFSNDFSSDPGLPAAMSSNTSLST